ncbi:odorant receptor 131-2-like [Synchiropus splendidus]|uniref:odorant receptor 131-2-like n=1 Tax=Synchiropus splendidus TaxID=270530 RepID=UPI00237D375D|nr:odorant receptor 131-2-like [Synchiropus splendidus]
MLNNASGATQAQPSLTQVRVVLSMLPCAFFLYINGAMLLALLRKPVLLESSRYVLFGHLLFTDSLQLLSAMQLYILAASRVRLISYGCILVNILIAYFIVKLPPLNLAVMSLERYVAICLPLQHAQITTRRRTGLAIAAMWSLASLDSATHLFFFIRMESSTFTLSNFCTRRAIFRLQAYTTISMVFNFSIFISVSLIIILTYVAIMSSSANVRNTRKARRTVLLHFLQLWMCLTSILFPLMPVDPQWNLTPITMGLIQYGLFLVLIIFPKCLSPLIYGLRDKAFRQIFKYYFTFGLRGDTRP